MPWFRFLPIVSRRFSVHWITHDEQTPPTYPSLAIPFRSRPSLAPVKDPTLLPSLRKKKEGKTQTPRIVLIAGTSSTSTFTKTISGCSRASASTTGAMCLQGGHLSERYRKPTGAATTRKDVERGANRGAPETTKTDGRVSCRCTHGLCVAFVSTRVVRACVSSHGARNHRAEERRGRGGDWRERCGVSGQSERMARSSSSSSSNSSSNKRGTRDAKISRQRILVTTHPAALSFCQTSQNNKINTTKTETHKSRSGRGLRSSMHLFPTEPRTTNTNKTRCEC
mmetsp:Transcript_21592/g.48536  ORF Transcript_21592/g.48536 Transcript_21592/m.48536 type:complete len:282 (+) Transcript_21592:2755-3600(+)